jgi:RecA-family ATPase
MGISREQARQAKAQAQANNSGNATVAQQVPPPHIINLSDYGAERFIGPPPPVKWLVEGVFPLGVPGVLAAMGDTGKSFSALNLCYHIASEPEGNLAFNLPLFGGRVSAHGTAVFITSEDSEAEIHRRLAVIDPTEHRGERPGKLIIVALPDAGGPMPFFVCDAPTAAPLDELFLWLALRPRFRARRPTSVDQLHGATRRDRP